MEFGNAIHLIQRTLLGHKLPTELPECLAVECGVETNIPYMNTSEYAAYRALHQSSPKDVKGCVDCMSHKNESMFALFFKQLLLHLC